MILVSVQQPVVEITAQQTLIMWHADEKCPRNQSQTEPESHCCSLSCFTLKNIIESPLKLFKNSIFNTSRPLSCTWTICSLKLVTSLLLWPVRPPPTWYFRLQTVITPQLVTHISICHSLYSSSRRTGSSVQLQDGDTMYSVGLVPRLCEYKWHNG